MSTAPTARTGWPTARGSIGLERPRILGILNITPDSFYDGGRFDRPAAAVAHAERLLEEGADVLDLGGESTRPGAARISADEERRRILPVLEAIVRRWPEVPVSIDTVKADVARAALAAGAAIINDVSGLRLDPALAEVVAAAGAGLVLMHSRGTVEDMASYDLAQYGADPIATVIDELLERVAAARAAGVPDDAIVLDPGFGFAKRTEHSIAVLAHLDRLVALGYPVLVGPSRKRFVGEAGGGVPVGQRLEGTVAACVIALLKGARLFRVHDVAEVRRALALAEAVREAG